MFMKVMKSKGMRDLFPVDMQKFRLISEYFREACLKWGYEEVRTPTLENLHLFTSAGTLTPGMLGKVYTFLDWDGWSGERVVLRPDATIPVARLYIESMADKELAKLFYIANTFIFEETGKQNRERWQLGAELIGIGSPLADVELIALAVEILGQAGLENLEIRLSHAGLTRGILQKSGFNSEEQHQVLDRLLDGDASVNGQILAEKPELAQLLSLRGQSSGFVKNLAAALDLPELKPQIDDLVYISDALKGLGLKYQIDVASVRGFEYYTGVIFQIFVNDVKVAGGGRYDALIPAMGGQNRQASGVALYLDQLMPMVEPSSPEIVSYPRICLKMSPATMKTGFGVADYLRRRGFTVKLHLGGQGPSDVQWQLELKNEQPVFCLTDLASSKKYEIADREGVAERLAKTLPQP
jgi:histidyl-tRNA synthetase